jgi:myosin heavy subunit
MASESTDEPVSVSLPPDLAEWVDEQADERDVDRETLLVQLLAAHHAAADIADSADLDVEVLADATDLEDEVRNIVTEGLSDIAGAVADQIDVEGRVEAAIEESLSAAIEERFPEVVETATEEASTQVTEQVQDTVQELESDFMAKVEDVRERVIQVKQETDGKAPADHDHPDLAADVEAVEATLADLQTEVQDLQEGLDTRIGDLEATSEDVEETLSNVQERLRTIAYVVNDLREQNTLENKRASSVEGIKRTAAEHDIDRARCSVCGEGVDIALMTDPECPHCDATVTSLRPSEGFFGKAELVKAQGIEAPEDEEQ